MSEIKYEIIKKVDVLSKSGSRVVDKAINLLKN